MEEIIFVKVFKISVFNILMKLLLLIVTRTSIEDLFMDLTKVMSVIRFFRQKESHRSEKYFPLYFFIF